MKRGQDRETSMYRLIKSVYELKKVANYCTRNSGFVYWDRDSPEEGTINVCLEEQKKMVAPLSCAGLKSFWHRERAIFITKNVLEGASGIEDRCRLHWFLGVLIMREGDRVSYTSVSRTRANFVLNKMETRKWNRIYRSLVGSFYLEKEM